MEHPEPKTLCESPLSAELKWWISGVVIPIASLAIAILAVESWRGAILSACGFKSQSTKQEAPLETVTERDLETYRELESIKVERRFREK